MLVQALYLAFPSIGLVLSGPGLLLLILVLAVILGYGGYWYAPRRQWSSEGGIGAGLALVLVILLVLWLCGFVRI